MKEVNFILVLLVVLTLAGCRDQRSISIQVTPSNEVTLTGWQTVVSPDGRFVMLFPGEPVESQHAIDSPAGNLKVRSFKYFGSASYFVGYTDYATPIDKPEIKDAVLDHARDNGVKQVDGKLVSETNISLRGYPGRLLIVESPNGGPHGSLIRNRVYLVGRRLYSMQVAIPRDIQPGSPEAKALDAAATKFLDSFDLDHGVKGKP